jgi:16S rRNA processing protein RimM
MSADNSGGRIILGRITGAHGLRGEIRIQTYTGLPEDIAAYGALSDEAGTRQFNIVDVRAAKGDTVIAELKGVSSREAAEALRGEKLYITREQLPPPDEDEYYLTDLVGLDAAAPDGIVFGRVIAVHNFGAGDLLEIRPAAADKTAIIPFTKDCVPEIHIDRGMLIVVMPE